MRDHFEIIYGKKSSSLKSYKIWTVEIEHYSEGEFVSDYEIKEYVMAKDETILFINLAKNTVRFIRKQIRISSLVDKVFDSITTTSSED